MLPFAPHTYATPLDTSRRKFVTATLCGTVLIGSLLQLSPTVAALVALHFPAVIRGQVWSLITFNIFDSGILKLLISLPLTLGICDTVEEYLTSVGLLRLLLPAVTINGVFVVLTAIVHWRLTHNETVFFGFHASELAILGCLSVAWVQGHSHSALPSDEPADHQRKLISTNVFPAPVTPVWRNRRVQLTPWSAVAAHPWYTSLFEGFAYKLQTAFLILTVLCMSVERTLGVESPRWLGTLSMVDLWCFSYGSFAGWLWLRYFYFYASTNSRGDPSAAFDFAKVFFPPSAWRFVSPFFSQVHSLAAKSSIFRLTSTAPVPRANLTPVLPLAGPDTRDSGLTKEQKALRQKGMEMLKHHISNPSPKTAIPSTRVAEAQGDIEMTHCTTGGAGKTNNAGEDIFASP